MVLKYKKVRPGAALPGRATPGSAAADLRAVCGDEGVTLQPMGRAVIPTGIAVELPGPEYVALVFARSGLAVKNGLTLSNGVGVIDSDYGGAGESFGQALYGAERRAHRPACGDARCLARHAGG